MVFIVDEGNVFKAPLNKLWQYQQSPESHQHPSQINPQFVMEVEHPKVIFDARMPDGRLVKNKIRMTAVAPVGFTLEYLEGPFAGSKSFTYYVPKGNETGVTVMGEYTSPVDVRRAAEAGSLDVARNSVQR